MAPATESVVRPIGPQARGNAPAVVASARSAARSWARTPLRERLRVIRRLRGRLGGDPGALAATADPPWRAHTAETLTAEVLPLLAACRFLEEEAPRILRPRRSGLGRRPLWLFGSRLEIRRDPLGVVLILGPANYPILLAGVQALQALTAGNAVVVKPGEGGRPAMEHLARELAVAGLPAGVLHVLPESVEDGQDALDAGVDKVLLTGSATTGRAVSRRLSTRPIPAVFELSGNDAVIVRDDARLDLAARTIAFGLDFNGGFTCIAPRRILVAESVRPEFERLLTAELEQRPPVRLVPGSRDRLVALLVDAVARGGRLAAGEMPSDDLCRPILVTDPPEDANLLRAEIAAPAAVLVPIADDDDAVRLVADCPYRLGAAIFAGDRAAARRLAARLDVGVVVLDDLIVPTADPRAPFGGRGRSGFGTTRGAEGLLELTAPKAILQRRGSLRPHLDPVGPEDAALFEAMIRFRHAPSLPSKLRALLDLVREGRARRRRAGGAR